MINSSLNIENIKSSICNLTLVERTNQGFEVTLPQIYHNGTSVVVVIAPQVDGFIIHDNGYAAMLLSSSGFQVGKRVADAVRFPVQSYGCELDQMRVTKRCETMEQVAVSATLVGCASRLIADQSLGTPQAPMVDFKSSVISRVVSAVGVDRVRANEEVSGRLGSTYRVSTVVLNSERSNPIAFIEPIGDREAIPRRFKEFYDLSKTPGYQNIDRIAVYDDAKPLPSGDALLLQEVGSLVRFSDASRLFNSWATIQ
jgi:hypothetical protein